jgi:hypothetical protein
VFFYLFFVCVHILMQTTVYITVFCVCAIYDWVKSTGTLRLDPEDEERKLQRNPNYPVKQYKTLNNRCMELRKTCNHPLLNYPFFSDLSKEFIVKSCGKLWILDRILIKLQRTGHRVLLFSTMTKLLDILEEYLKWRRLVYRRIDGTRLFHLLARPSSASKRMVCGFTLYFEIIFFRWMFSISLIKLR